MPRLLKKERADTRLRMFTLPEQLYALMPADDPLKKQVRDAAIEKNRKFCTNEYDGCELASYMDSCERKKKKKKDEIAYSFAMYVMKLKELEQEASLHPKDPFTVKVKESAIEHLSQPGILDMLSELENKKAEKKVNRIKIKEEDRKLARYREELDEISNMQRPEDMNEVAFFENQKELTLDKLAKIIAAQTSAKTVKSMKAGAQDLADNGQGDGMTQQEFDKEIAVLLSDDYLENAAEFIKTRDDFRIIADSVTDKDKLEALVSSAKKGNELLDMLHQAGKEIINEGTQRVRMEQHKQNEKTPSQPQRLGI